MESRSEIVGKKWMSPERSEDYRLLPGHESFKKIDTERGHCRVTKFGSPRRSERVGNIRIRVT